MGSLEDLFAREEIKWHTYDDILDYLSDDGKRRKASYKNVATILAEPTSVKERAEDTLIVEDLLELEQEADNLEPTNARRETLRIVRDRLKEASRAIDLPRLPRQPEIKRVTEYSDLFAPMIEEIATEELGKSVTNEEEWLALESGERRIISREITRRLTGK